jgi:hypothetical protein
MYVYTSLCPVPKAQWVCVREEKQSERAKQNLLSLFSLVFTKACFPSLPNPPRPPDSFPHSIPERKKEKTKGLREIINK